MRNVRLFCDSFATPLRFLCEKIKGADKKREAFASLLNVLHYGNSSPSDHVAMVLLQCNHQKIL